MFRGEFSRYGRERSAHSARIIDEWLATYDLLQHVKARLDEKYAPAGYNIGWNCGSAAGQHIPHAHLHVIPRFEDEPLAGKGIRHWLKQPNNMRPSDNVQ